MYCLRARTKFVSIGIIFYDDVL